MPLPTDVVSQIFGKLSLSYGHRFLSLYDGFDDPDATNRGADPWALVKADWAQELGGVAEHRILWALQNLPEQPPDAPKFRALCAKAPEPDKPIAIEDQRKPKPLPGRVAKAMERWAEASDDERPEKVQIAANFIAKWGCPGVRLSPFKRDWLAHSRRIVEQWEREKAREAAAQPQETAA